jgi:hypothetical protein
MLSMTSSGTMSAIISIGTATKTLSDVVVRVGEPRVSRAVTAGLSDADFEAWLAKQGAVRMSDERHAALRLAFPGVGS